MDPILIGIAFAFGFAARQVGQPPLVGFLLAGFVAHACGFAGGPALNAVADLGVTLLLFMIGLELDLRRLLRVVQVALVESPRRSIFRKAWPF